MNAEDNVGKWEPFPTISKKVSTAIMKTNQYGDHSKT